MRSFLTLLLSFCLAGSVYANADIDKDLRYLEQHLDAYPPQVENDGQLKEVRAVYKRVEKVLLALDKKAGKDAKLKCKIGNFYRMGHNLDEEGAWEKSERYLKQAIAIDGKEYEAYYLLGCLYVNSDVALAPKAEKLFQFVRENASGDLGADAVWGLCISSWMQGKKERTLEIVNEYLKLRPGNEAALSMKAMAEAGVKNIGR